MKILKRENKETENKDKVKLSLKDFVALTIATYQILLPIFIGFFVVFTVIVLVVTKCWMK